MFERIKFCGELFFKLVRVFFQIIYGAWRLSGLPKPLVSIFGGARLPKEGSYFQKAHELARRFAEHDISVITGGGPGAMEAANCGVVEAKSGRGKTMGIGVKGLEGRNPCVDQYFELNYFFARKWLLTQYSTAFIVFPGGFGTLDELAEVLTLIQTKKIKRVPIVLFGIEYWDDLMHWIEKEALVHGLIAQEDLELFTMTDNLDEAFCVVRNECAVKK